MIRSARPWGRAQYITCQAAARREKPRMEKPKLPFHSMAGRHSGLTQATAEYLTEAARVCLDRHHESPIEFEISNAGSKTEAIAEWQKTDDRTRGAWANEIDTTEAGACACTLAAVELSDGLVAVHRAETKTGADYYVAPEGEEPGDLEDCIRLEVSGVDRGNAAAVARRLREKLDQAAAGASNLPAIAGVVGFRAHLILLSLLEES